MPLSLRKTRRAARRAVDRTVLSIVNGVAYLVDGAARPQIGNAPKTLVFSRDKLQLFRLRPIEAEEVELGTVELKVDLVPRVGVPVLVIPPLMVRPFVYDLRPEHSMLRTLRNAGFDVFFVDFGVPDDGDEGVRLDDYVLDYIPRCVDAALEVSGKRELSVIGYCMGGIFALLHVATFADVRVKNIVTIGAPIDFDKMGLLGVAARVGSPLLDSILDRLGNVPGQLSSAGFRLMSGTRALTKWADLVANLYDEQYVREFDAIDTWLRQMIPYPKEAFRQMVNDVVRGNKLLRNELVFGDKAANLRNVTCPILAFYGKTDNIATPASTAAILKLTSAADAEHRGVTGGHIGVVAGSKAPEEVWQPMIAWLRERAGPN